MVTSHDLQSSSSNRYHSGHTPIPQSFAAQEDPFVRPVYSPRFPLPRITPDYAESRQLTVSVRSNEHAFPDFERQELPVGQFDSGFSQHTPRIAYQIVPTSHVNSGLADSLRQPLTSQLSRPARPPSQLMSENSNIHAVSDFNVDYGPLKLDSRGPL